MPNRDGLVQQGTIHGEPVQCRRLHDCQAAAWSAGLRVERVGTTKTVRGGFPAVFLRLY